VIPLSRGRKIPIEGGMGTTNIHNHNYGDINVNANDPNAFRASSGSIARTQNTQLKRAATRNLTANA
jgi:hypothetical protein